MARKRVVATPARSLVWALEIDGWERTIQLPFPLEDIPRAKAFLDKTAAELGIRVF